MIEFCNEAARKRHDETLEFAKVTNQMEAYQNKIEYLGDFACHEGQETRCELGTDFAPYSFSFMMYLRKKGSDEFKPWFNGGLIYHGPHDGFGDGGAPMFSVNLNGTQGWSVHT